MASRTSTALNDVPDSELMPSFDDDEPTDAQPAPEPAAEASPEPQEAAPEPEPTPEPTEEPAAETASEDVPAEPQSEESPQQGMVPSFRLKEESDRRREAESNYSTLQQQFGQLQGQLTALQQQLQPQPKQAPIDPYEDPQGYAQQQNAQIENVLNQRLAEQSRAFAYQMHGQEVVDQAYQWAINNLPLHQANAVALSADMYGECVKLKKQHDALQEFGTDPEAYRKRVLEAALQDPEFISKVQVAQQQHVQATPSNGPKIDVPPSLSGAAPAGDAKAGRGEQLPTSDADIFNDALAYNPYK